MTDADLLESLLEGEPPFDVEVPEDLDGLAMLADLLATAEAPPATMRDDAKSALRNQLIRTANARAAAPPPLLTRIRESVTGVMERWKYSSRAALASGTAAMVLSTGGVAAAATGSVPGDVFYGVKLATEDVMLSFAAPGIPRGDGLLDQAINRIGEADTAAQRARWNSSAEALRLADDHTRDGAQEYLAAYLDGGDTAILGELGDWVITTNRRLDLLPEQHGPSIQALADLRTSLNRIGQRIEVLTTGACTSCGLGVHDDPDAPPTVSRGLQADGTPPTPGGAPVDLTFIPPANQPFQACPCVAPAPPGSAVPAPPPQTDDTGPDPQQPQAGAGGDPGGASQSGGGSSGGGGSPLPAPLPDTSPVTDPLPDPVREAVEEVIEQIPVDPGQQQPPGAPDPAPPDAEADAHPPDASAPETGL